jgi:hypothetical protein
LTELNRRFSARIRYFNLLASEPSAPVTHLDQGGVDVADAPLAAMPPHKNLGTNAFPKRASQNLWLGLSAVQPLHGSCAGRMVETVARRGCQSTSRGFTNP